MEIPSCAKFSASNSKWGITMFTKIRNLLKSKNGATAVEYALLAALIGAAIATAASTLGTDVSTSLNNVSAELNAE
mgnify:CR=1 FL=1